MLEAIHENHLRTQELKAMIIKEREERNKRQERNILIVCGIALVVLIIVNAIHTNKSIEKCIKKGYTENYCISQLG